MAHTFAVVSSLVVSLAFGSYMAAAQQQPAPIYDYTNSNYTAAQMACYPYAYMEQSETGPVFNYCLALNAQATAPDGSSYFNISSSWICDPYMTGLSQGTLDAQTAIGEYWNCLQTSGFLFTLLTEEQMAAAQSSTVVPAATGVQTALPTTPVDSVTATPVETETPVETVPAEPVGTETVLATGSAAEAVNTACVDNPSMCTALASQYASTQSQMVMDIFGRKLLQRQHRKAL